MRNRFEIKDGIIVHAPYLKDTPIMTEFFMQVGDLISVSGVNGYYDMHGCNLEAVAKGLRSPWHMYDIAEFRCKNADDVMRGNVNDYCNKELVVVDVDWSGFYVVGYAYDNKRIGFAKVRKDDRA